MVVIYAYLYSYNQFPCASSVFMFFIFTTLVRCMCRDVMWRSEDSFVDSVFSFHYVTLGDLTGRLSSKHLYPQSRLPTLMLWFVFLVAYFVSPCIAASKSPSLCRRFRATEVVGRNSVWAARSLRKGVGTTPRSVRLSPCVWHGKGVVRVISHIPCLFCS